MKITVMIVFLLIAVARISIVAQGAPMGSATGANPAETKALEALKGKVNGKIVWSTSRSNCKHDLWIMNADGTDQKQLTKGDEVDWYPRFSYDGTRVLFTRSKSGWESEAEADVYDKWDEWIINLSTKEEKICVENASWGTWRPSGDSIVFARGPKVFIKDFFNGEEKEIFDSEKMLKKGTYAQQPQLSPDGKLLAITLRGSKRETGIWNFQKSVWNSTGEGCQIDWFPDGKRVLRMNEGQGNCGTEVIAIRIDADGNPIDRIKGFVLPKVIRFMDLPGHISHEYFPRLDQQTGKWLVWCATQYGHEHDIFDYEVYVWNITTDKTRDFVRLTFHSGNDRWPDIFIGGLGNK